MGNVLKPQEGNGKLYSVFEREMLMAESELASPLEIIENARSEADRKVQEAYAEGMRRGIDAGKRQIEEQAAEAVRALERTAQVIQEARENYLDAMTPQIVALAHAMAQRILDREAKLDPDVVSTSARKAVENLLDRAHVTLRVNPEDLASLRDHANGFEELFKGVESVTVVGDDAIARGGCVAESETMTADAQLETQLSAILDTLSE